MGWAARYVFHEGLAFPNVIGALDCTHVRVKHVLQIVLIASIVFFEMIWCWLHYQKIIQAPTMFL